MTPRSIGVAGVAFALILDQVTKAVVLSIGSANPAWLVSVTPFFNIVLVRNDGISFGLLGSNVPWWVLSLVAIAVVAFLLRWLWGEASSFTAAGLGLIVGGALGNVVDRFWYGAVTDFLDFYAHDWHWPAFNFADIAICCGVAVLMVRQLTDHVRLFGWKPDQ